MEITKDSILEALKKVVAPGESQDIVSAGNIKALTINNNEIDLLISLSEKKGQFKAAIKGTCEDAIKRFVNAELIVKVRYESPESQQSVGGLSQVKHIIAVASGKGGVGKSTLTANLAVSLAKKGYKTGVIDADIFGPSIPKMFGLEGSTPVGTKIEDKDYIVPLEGHGVKTLSIGYFVKPQDAVAWRGPMAGKALTQLIQDTAWGELDFLLLDLPPGTSDIQLTIVQTVPLTGSIIVTTPQDIALIDAMKGIDFFKKDEVNVPILGLVENMAWFTPEELPENKYFIFGEGGGEKLSKEQNIPFLGHLPIVQGIREGGDQGVPVASEADSTLGKYFSLITDNALQQIQDRIENLPPTKVVDVYH